MTNGVINGRSVTNDTYHTNALVLPRHRIRTILPEHLVRFGDVLDGAVLAIVQNNSFHLKYLTLNS